MNIEKNAKVIKTHQLFMFLFLWPCSKNTNLNSLFFNTDFYDHDMFWCQRFLLIVCISRLHDVTKVFLRLATADLT